VAHKHTVLVVDDEADVVKSVSDLLRLDYRVLGATRAADGLQIMEKEEVHVVMTDQRMPGMSGVEFLHNLRGNHPDAIRLLITGYADIRAVIDAINQGKVFRYITKPWDSGELQAVIHQAVEHFELIVQRKQLLDELQKKNADLEQAVRQMSEANDLKTAFIRVASHELRTPLTILNGATRLASQTAATDPAAVQWINRIDRAAKWMQHLVDQLLTMLLVGEHELKPSRRPANLAQVVLDSAEDVRLFVDLRHQQLTTEVDQSLAAVSIDESMIRNALDHLLLNAIKFTPDGGQISVQTRRTGDNVELAVRDTGVGIEPANQAKLFQPFFTGYDVSRHSSGIFEYNKQGLGLGLSMVKAFVDMHGGKIGVDSKPGQGTTFTIALPLAA
jgi:signal transduction histidine kinase